MSETATTNDSSSTDRPDDFEIVTDAATLAYAVYRRVDFDKINHSRNFDDEFVGHIESATQTGSVMGFVSGLTDQAEVRAIHEMDGNTRSLVRKYDNHAGVARSRRFLRVVRHNPAHVVLEMKYEHVNGGDSDAN